MYEIRHFVSTAGIDLFSHWLTRVRDPIAKVQIVKRVNRMEQGNFGDNSFVGDGVWEMRVDVGAGYRIYYARAGAQIMLLLCGGDKRTQDVDIKDAKDHWKDWQRRSAS